MTKQLDRMTFTCRVCIQQFKAFFHRRDSVLSADEISLTLNWWDIRWTQERWCLSCDEKSEDDSDSVRVFKSVLSQDYKNTSTEL